MADALMFIYDGSAAGTAARLPQWNLERDGDGTFLVRGMEGVSGVIVPVKAHELGALDEIEARDGFGRAIAMIEVGGKRTWAFFYTRTTDWREKRTLQYAM